MKTYIEQTFFPSLIPRGWLKLIINFICKLLCIAIHFTNSLDFFTFSNFPFAYFLAYFFYISVISHSHSPSTPPIFLPIVISYTLIPYSLQPSRASLLSYFPIFFSSKISSLSFYFHPSAIFLFPLNSHYTTLFVNIFFLRFFHISIDFHQSLCYPYIIKKWNAKVDNLLYPTFRPTPRKTLVSSDIRASQKNLYLDNFIQNNDPRLLFFEL